ncbi:hypothetical protein [Caproiciproducens faecalis]|uniref:AAA+ ATPase domain-containing protein n=1 Tax=Caproiciproducens faecalis TaxID=2820301 RepID=A0ABS7DPV6_9FIRM|nr:hypothetical protein [Caproiciproducens faecalis]MBW7573149.1 hypothetical protein [Caproiciproducens faecalis]
MINGQELLLELLEHTSLEPTILFLGDNFQAEDMEKLLSFPWACVYTTSSSSTLTNYFRPNKHRRVADVVVANSDSQISLNWRELAIVRLRGLEGYTADPITQEANEQSLLEILPTLLDSYGRVVFCGFDFSQAESILLMRQLFMQFAKVKRKEFLYFFNIAEQIQNPYLDRLVTDGVATLIPQEIKELWDALEEEDLLPELSDSEIDHYLLYANGQKIYMDGELDRQLLLNIEPFAKLLEYHEVEQSNLFPSEASIQYFQAFLQNSTVGMPQWYGYRNDNMFHLERYFEKKLYETAVQALHSAAGQKRQALPVMLCGQACSGKTNALGALAYKMFCERQYPVIFIPDHEILFTEESIKTNEGTIEKERPDTIKALDELLRNLENKMVDPVPTLIIWDTACRIQSDLRKAYDLLNLLRSGGRRVQIVCTAYERKLDEERAQYNCVDVKATLQPGEHEQVESLLVEKAGFNEQDAKDLIKVYGNQESFLGELYLFEDLHKTLRNRIQRENEGGIEDVGRLLTELAEQKAQEIMDTVLGRKIREAMEKSGKSLSFLLSSPSKPDDSIIIKKAQAIKKTFQTLICCIAVCTIYNKEMPLSMAVRFLGAYSTETSRMLHILMSNTLLRSRDAEDDGEPLLSLRSKLEAKMLQKTYDLNPIDLIISMLHVLSPSSNREQYLIQDLISLIGPNSRNQSLTLWTNPNCYPKFWTLLDELSYFREKNPGTLLLLTEITLTREIFNSDNRWKEEHSQKECIDRLDKMRLISEKEIQQRCNEPLNKSLASLYVEWGNLCIRLSHYDDRLSKRDLWKNVGKSMVPIMRQYPENGFAYSAYLWAGVQYLDSLTDNDQKLTLAEKLCHINDMMPQEEKTDGLSGKLDHLLDTLNMNDDRFRQSIQEGKAYGIYFRTRQLLGSGNNRINFKEPIMKKEAYEICKEVNDILETSEYSDIVWNDSACLHILINVKWLLETGLPIIPEWGKENNCMKLSEEMWERLFELSNRYLELDEMRPPHIVYLLALCMAQLPQHRGIECEQLFEELRKGTVYEKRRLHILCNEQGKPLIFSGRINRYDHKRNRGYVNLQEAGFRLPIYFRGELIGQMESSLHEGTLLTNLNVATSFSGLQACRI